MRAPEEDALACDAFVKHIRGTLLNPRQSFRPDDVVHGLFGHLYLKRLWAQMSVKNREKLEIQELSLSCLALPEQMRK